MRHYENRYKCVPIFFHRCISRCFFPFIISNPPLCQNYISLSSFYFKRKPILFISIFLSFIISSMYYLLMLITNTHILERQRKLLDNSSQILEDRIDVLCSQLKEAKFIAEESDKKYEEVGNSVEFSRRFRISRITSVSRSNLRPLFRHFLSRTEIKELDNSQSTWDEKNLAVVYFYNPIRSC